MSVFSWKDWLNLKYYPMNHGRIAEISFRQVHLNDLKPDQVQEMINQGANPKWKDAVGRPLVYHLVDVSCGLKPLPAESLDVFFKNGMNPNLNVNAILEPPCSLMEKIAQDENSNRREEYFNCLFKNGLDLSWESCGKKTIFTLMALHKERASSDVRMILDSNQIDVEQSDGLQGRTILDWADNGYLCDSRNREVIYAYYHKQNPKKADKREKLSTPLFLSQQDARWAEEKRRSVQEEKELMERICRSQTEKEHPQSASSEISPLKTIIENLNEEMIKQGLQLLHRAGKIMSAAGEQAQKINTQDIKIPSVQKMKEMFDALTR